MKPIPITALLPLTLCAWACQAPHGERPYATDQMWVGEALRQAQIQQAIVEQQAVQPYHFEAESAELNELGQLELGILAARYRSIPGTLNVRRGRAAEALYRARVASVVDFLSRAGIDPGVVAITDGWPGGDGMPSERVNEILTAPRETWGATPGEAGSATSAGSMQAGGGE